MYQCINAALTESDPCRRMCTDAMWVYVTTVKWQMVPDITERLKASA